MNEFIEIKTEEEPEEKGEYTPKRRVYSVEEIENEYYPRVFYAGFFIRFFSFLVDSLIAGLIVKILLDSILAITGINPSLKIYGILSTLIFLSYFTISTYLIDGQSLGKMMFSLKVVKLDGSKLDLTTVIMREFVGRFIHTYGILAILYILTAFTEKKQNLSDLFADTSVISLSKENAYNIGKSKNRDSHHIVCDL